MSEPMLPLGSTSLTNRTSGLSSVVLGSVRDGIGGVGVSRGRECVEDESLPCSLGSVRRGRSNHRLSAKSVVQPSFLLL